MEKRKKTIAGKQQRQQWQQQQRQQQKPVLLSTTRSEWLPKEMSIVTSIYMLIPRIHGLVC